MIAARVLAVLLAVALSGCATIQQEREKRFQPEAVNPPEVEQMFVADYQDAIVAARNGAWLANIVRLVDAGSALSAVRCGAWIDRDILAAQGIVASDHMLGVIGAMTTMAAGAFGLHPSAVAGVGAVQLAGTMLGQTVKSGLGAPESFQAQVTMLTTLSSCSDKLIAQAKGGHLGFAQAVIGVDRCRRFCSPGAASAITTQALAQTEVVVSPSGAMSVQAITSTAVKDDAGARLRDFWRPGGVVDRAADARIRAWMAANGIESSITMLANSALYAAARAKAVADLGIGP